MKLGHWLILLQLAGRFAGMAGNFALLRILSNDGIDILVYLSTAGQFVGSLARMGTDYAFQTETRQYSRQASTAFLLLNLTTSVVVLAGFYVTVGAYGWGNSKDLSKALLVSIGIAVLLESITDLPWEVSQKMGRFKATAARNAVMSITRPIIVVLLYIWAGIEGVVAGFLATSVINLGLGTLTLRDRYLLPRRATFWNLRRRATEIKDYIKRFLSSGWLVGLSAFSAALLVFPLLSRLEDDSYSGLLDYRIGVLLTQVVLAIPAALSPILIVKNTESVLGNNNQESDSRIRRIQLRTCILGIVICAGAAIFVAPAASFISGGRLDTSSPESEAGYLAMISTALLCALREFQLQRPDRGVRLYVGACILIGTNCACFGLGYIFLVPHFGFLGYSLTQYLAALTSLVLLLVRDSFSTIKIQELLAIGLATLLLWVSRIAI